MQKRDCLSGTQKRSDAYRAEMINNRRRGDKPRVQKRWQTRSHTRIFYLHFPPGSAAVKARTL